MVVVRANVEFYIDGGFARVDMSKKGQPNPVCSPLATEKVWDRRWWWR